MVSVATSTTALTNLLSWLDMDFPWRNDALGDICFILKGRIDEYIPDLLDNLDYYTTNLTAPSSQFKVFEERATDTPPSAS